MYLSDLFAVTASVDELSPNSSRLAETANKFDKYLMLHVQIWAPDDERKNRSKHVERWQ
jgi:hypothetical protein